MRGGKILAEESPEKLIASFGTETLEEVFLILSRKQDESKLNSAIASMDTPDDSHMNANTGSTNTSTVSLVMTDLGSTNVCISASLRGVMLRSDFVVVVLQWVLHYNTLNSQTDRMSPSKSGSNNHHAEILKTNEIKKSRCRSWCRILPSRRRATKSAA